MTNMVPFDRVWNRKEAAEMLGISIASLRKLEKAGQLQPINITARVIGYRDSHIRRFVNEREGGAHGR